MSGPELPCFQEDRGEQERRLGLAREITAILRGQVPELSRGSMLREAAWRGGVSDNQQVSVKYMGLYGKVSAEEATIVNEGGQEAETTEITYECKTKFSEDAPGAPTSVLETLVVQSGLEQRRGRLTEREVALLQLTHDALIQTFGPAVREDRRHSPPTA